MNILRMIRQSWIQGKIENLAGLYMEAGMQVNEAYQTAAYVIGKRMEAKK